MMMNKTISFSSARSGQGFYIAMKKLVSVLSIVVVGLCNMVVAQKRAVESGEMRSRHILAVSGSNQALPQLGKSPLKEVINAMTTEEKARLLVGMGFEFPVPGIPPMDPED